jgi:tetratricopeptide (TPR) repeat protein
MRELFIIIASVIFFSGLVFRDNSFNWSQSLTLLGMALLVNLLKTKWLRYTICAIGLVSMSYRVFFEQPFDKRMAENHRKRAILKYQQAYDLYWNYPVGHQHTVMSALSLLDEAIETDPSYTDSYKLKILIIEPLNKDNEALALIDSIVKYDPTNTVAYTKRGIINERLMNNSEAHRDYEHALHLYDSLITRGKQDFLTCTNRAFLLYLIDGKDAGLSELKKLQTDSIYGKERSDLDSLIEELENTSREDWIFRDNNRITLTDEE